MALVRLERGDIIGAGTIIDRLLAYNPYFTPAISDPQRFIDMINERKQQEAGITTASRQAESIEESPVPVTLITEAMIRCSGAQTLQELLCLYVPGMSIAEGLEANIAMHGITSISQEKILFLQDGHRLNGYSTNAEAPDYRNSLDKIQQIEVLRGPASSLYGNVALTAVVNIITRKGAVLNGGRISVLAGSQKTYGTTFAVGGGNNAVDILGWGSIQATDGFRYTYDNVAYSPTNMAGITKQTTVYAHAFNRRPSYDIGIKGRWRDFSLTFNSQRSKQTPYINILQIPATKAIEYDATGLPYLIPSTPSLESVQNYNYDRYHNIKSNGPGITRTNHHLNVDYSHSFGAINIQASGYVSMEHTSFYNVMGDSINFNIGATLLRRLQEGAKRTEMSQVLENMLMQYYVKTAGAFQVLEWENLTFGGQAQILAKYRLAGHGNAVVGCQYEHFALTDGVLYLGGSYSTQQMVSSGEVFNDGMEDIYSSYLQLKHFFSDEFIVNAGLRFDHKIRFDDATLNRFSPRISLIYKIGKNLSARASYNYSFVDAPYIYRACNVKMFSGGKDMKPETMRSFQIGATYHRQNSPLSAEISFYRNRLEDLVTLVVGGEYLFRNSAQVTQAGFEGAAQYTSDSFFANTNFTWQKFIESEGYTVHEDNPFGVPQFMGNVTVAASPWHGKGKGFFTGGKVWLRGTLNAQSATYYQMTDILLSTSAKKAIGQIEKVNPQCIIGLGLGYEWKHLDIDIIAQNITNNDFKVGSLLADGVPRKGRQILGKMTIKF
jgi:iron complex outermembrane receptor protein